ncbi:hypothetical protein ASG39_03010 [Rhizobium sp. Leaf371]|uniref:hypothetical protein n=1 Tax=Rhizobium sp. Leaf371 TaxID=1736355 RepID=UPI000715E539|nr:hypothetical protein [Rhizobium sp. Leaf371]KQS72733.1 hypothetical protein ASG39_03010 [Rhizobium sp. Leaf371]
MSETTPAKSNIAIAKQRDGTWSFILTFRGVTHPATGKFPSQLQAQTAGMAALKALEGRSRG